MYGWVSVRGVRVAGHFLPGSMTYLHGVIEVGWRICLSVAGHHKTLSLGMQF